MNCRNYAVVKAACFASLLVGISHASAADVTITATSGMVTITEAGQVVPAAIAAKLTLPLEIHTGAAGSIDLQQLGSTMHVGPNSVLILPMSASQQGPVDKILQESGYVLYNIKSRKEHPLAVETPYLVSVVKGTVFTIAVEENAATVALMEGSLDISAPGVTDRVLLKPNESIHHVSGAPHLTAHPTASAAYVQPGNAELALNTALPDSSGSTQMAQVARDFADAGAAVAPSSLVAALRPTLAPPSTGGAVSTANTTSISTTSATSGTVASGPGTTGAQNSSGSPATTAPATGSGTPTSPAADSPGTAIAATDSGSSTGSTGTIASGTSSSGTAGTLAAVTTPNGTTGSPSAGGTQTASAGSTAAATTPGITTTTPTLTSTTPIAGCNGKSSGTGSGKCLGHSKGKGD